MKTPFSTEQFLNIFQKYNESVFPVQIILYILGFVALYLVVKPTGKSDRFVSSILSLLWLWMGIVYHLAFFTAINKAAYLFGVAFIIQGILFLLLGVLKDKISFKFRANIFGITGIILIIFALIIYPLLGYFLGHVYPTSPTFGLPCPTTIFTCGILLMTVKKFPMIVFIIPFLWSIIGFTAVWNFGILEDTGLVISGLVTFILMLFRNSKLKEVE